MSPSDPVPLRRFRRAWIGTLAGVFALLGAGCALPGSAAPVGGPDPSTPVVREPQPVDSAPAEPVPPRMQEPPVFAGDRPTADPHAEGSGWADRTLARMTLRDKAAQMMMVWVLGDFAPEGTASEERIRRLVETERVGGLIVSAGTPVDVAVKLNGLQGRAAVPLLVAADLEGGAGFRLRGALHVPTGLELGGATLFPLQMAFGAAGDPALAYEMGRITAIEARAVGIHVPFAPILDVNNNPDNPIINVRSFGEDPRLVALMGAEYVRGVQENGGIATGKHFPGHGDTGVDTHLELPVIDVSAERLDTIELVPFRAAVSAGIGGIMTAHVSVPAISGEPEPATLSPEVMTDLLRRRMGFEGLLFTDAMDMGAIVRGYGAEEATVRAVEAGADVILMPPAVEAAIDALVRAVESGRLAEERLDASVRRILHAKESLGLHVNPRVDPERIARRVGIPEHLEVAREVAERSLVLLRNDRGLLPLRGTRDARVLSVTYRRANDLLAGRHFDAVLRETYPRLAASPVDRDTPLPLWDALRSQARSSQLVVVSVYVTAWDAGAISDELVEFIQELGRRDIPHAVVSFGNPYLLRSFPGAQSYLLAWSGAEVSQRAAAAALFGRIPITGRVPTRIPPDHDVGNGIQLPARAPACCLR